MFNRAVVVKKLQRSLCFIDNWKYNIGIKLGSFYIDIPLIIY